jgi:hypothetical protein
MMNTTQNIWYKIRKALKFVWRHFFTLFDLSLSINVFIFHELRWKNALIFLSIAVVIDWAKQFMKLMPRRRGRFNDPFERFAVQPFRDQWWDSSLRGTPAHFLSHMDSNRYR